MDVPAVVAVHPGIANAYRDITDCLSEIVNRNGAGNEKAGSTLRSTIEKLILIRMKPAEAPKIAVYGRLAKILAQKKAALLAESGPIIC